MVPKFQIPLWGILSIYRIQWHNYKSFLHHCIFYPNPRFVFSSLRKCRNLKDQEGKFHDLSIPTPTRVYQEAQKMISIYIWKCSILVCLWYFYYLGKKIFIPIESFKNSSHSASTNIFSDAPRLRPTAAVLKVWNFCQKSPYDPSTVLTKNYCLLYADQPYYYDAVTFASSA